MENSVKDQPSIETLKYGLKILDEINDAATVTLSNLKSQGDQIKRMNSTVEERMNANLTKTDRLVSKLGNGSLINRIFWPF